MTVLLRILIVLCSLTTAAHFLRFGTLWDAAPALLPAAAAFFPRLLPRPLLVLAALGGALLWAGHGMELATWRINLGLPWARLALILGAVCLAHLGAALLMLGRTGKKLFGPLTDADLVRTATALLVGAVLVPVVDKTPFPLLLGERFFPGSEFFWICLFAIYGAMVSGWLLTDSRGKVRGRIWTLFSAVFFAQLLLGLAGWSIFLMTGKLHLPVPALILAGPLFRGEGFFMPILLGVSLVLTGPAWCSYLCYIGAWDDRLARLAPTRPAPLPAWAPTLRVGLLAATLLIPLALRLLGVPWTWALGLAAAFGIIGVLVMALVSRRSGTMVHCTAYCPIGLVNNLIGKVLPWRVRIDSGCTRCGVCAKACRYNALTCADLEKGRPGLTCSLCGDCLPRCPHGHLGYSFPGLTRERARQVFVTLAASLHVVFLAVARI
ncbi:MAG: 4Fe-4S binding protein [Desulfomicrobium sp.]|nr:4Fe-4S binding protein [Pseudomonadota bacterium]MBV1713457.1 4Fe-4S binding protein [Desulfomicrobium sp.]MBU4570409.1 4Fe-4S binding protein [Pseudomonadota bacterium]MBU4593766.1 4Fe-4S binding protein [Pseudomonadota bacterium]MBV1719780.1 4Fe-4S binding protein [Desulfomicrobium sp.]